MSRSHEAPRRGLKASSARGALVVGFLLSSGYVGCACGAGAVPADAGPEDAGPEGFVDTSFPPVDGGMDAQITACERATKTGDPLGCEYYVWYGYYNVTNLLPPNTSWACMALLVSNPGDAPAKLDVEFQGKGLDPSTFGRLLVGQGTPPTYVPLTNATLPPGGSAILALVQGYVQFPEIESCPFPAAFTGDNGIPYESKGSVFRVGSTEPVFVAHVYPFSEAWYARNVTTTSLRSTASWDTRYLDIGTYEPGRPPYIDGQMDTDSGTLTYHLETYPAYTALVASTTTKATLEREGGLSGVMLNAGQAIVLAQDDGFIGTAIQADHPIGVFTGMGVLQLPWQLDGGWYDGNWVFHQFAPASAWGWAYAAVRYPDRYDGLKDAAVWRFLGTTDGTVLNYEPAPPTGAPTALSAGQQVVFTSSDSFVVRAQDENHRFHVSELMTSCDVQCLQEYGDVAPCHGYGPVDCRGGPQLISTPPVEEYANRFAFVTPPDFPDNWLVVVRKKTAGVFEDVTLDCAGTLGGWTPLGTDFEYAYVALSRGNFEPQTYDGGTCANGAHTIQSAGLFSVTLWGWGTYATGFEKEVNGTSYAVVPYGIGPRPDRQPQGQN